MHPRRVPCFSLILVFVCCAPTFVAAGGEDNQETRRPNVLLIYTDDQGSVDAHCYGADDLITPHMDALADRGVRFTQFYSAALLQLHETWLKELGTQQP